MAFGFPNTLGVDYTVVKDITGTSNSGITGTLPSGCVVGDLLYVVVRCNNPAATLTITDGSGKLTLQKTNTASTGLYQVHTSIYTRIIDGTETNFPFTWNTNGTKDDVVICRRITGVNTTTPVGATSALNSSSGATPASLTLTTTANNSCVMFSVGVLNGNNLTAVDSNSPSGTTMLEANTTRSTSSGIIWGDAYQEYATAGTVVGTKTWNSPSNFLSSASYWAAFAIELLPANPKLINTITDPISSGGSMSFTGSGWTGGTFTGITSNVVGATVSGITGTTSSGSATLAGWVEASAYAALPSAVTFTFNDGTSTTTKSSNISVPAGYTKVPLASPDIWASTIAKAIFDATGRTIVDNDVFYHTELVKAVPDGEPSDLVITPDTDWSVTDAGSFDLWLRVAAGADAGKMFYYGVTITESGAVVVTPSNFLGSTIKGRILSGSILKGKLL